MNYSVIILLKAQLDVLNAKAWYEDESPGLGEQFAICHFVKIRQNQTRVPT